MDDRRTRGYTGSNPLVVRWRVGSRAASRSFPTRAAAADFEARLRVAANDGVLFDTATGLPAAWATVDLTVASWAHRWFTEQATTWAPSSRQNAADVLVKLLPVLVRAKASAPPDTIRGDIRSWLAGDTVCPPWLGRWSIFVHEATPAVCEQAARSINIRDDGAPVAPSTVARNRRVARSMFSAAVKAGVLVEQPWPEAGRVRAATHASEQVVTAMLPSPGEVRAVLDSLVSHKGGGYRVIAAVIYYAGLRPGEALGLKAERCVLPDEGWGSVGIVTTSRTRTRWTADGEAFGPPKSRSTRVVPIPPVLVDILRTHLDGRRTGLVVATRSGRPVAQTNLSRAFSRVTNGRWSPYDLRDAAATIWLQAGVSPAAASHRLGNSPAMLMAHYAGVMVGDETELNRRVEEATAK